MVSSSISCGLRFLFYSFLFQFQFPGGIHVYSDSPHQLFSTQVVLVLIPISSNIRKISCTRIFYVQTPVNTVFLPPLALPFSPWQPALFWGNDRRDLPVLGWVAWPVAGPIKMASFMWNTWENGDFNWFHVISSMISPDSPWKSTGIHWNPVESTVAVSRKSIYNIYIYIIFIFIYIYMCVCYDIFCPFW